MTDLGWRRVGRLAALTLSTATVVLTAGSSSAAPGEPVPVKDRPGFVEVAPTAAGAWFGWAQGAGDAPQHYDFYVQRGAGKPIKVNAPRTEGFSGGIVGRSVFYAQRLGDRLPRIQRFDLRTGKRTPLPAKVNHFVGRVDGHRVERGVWGDVSASGPWVLYTGYDHGGGYYDTISLYNTATHRVRQVAKILGDVDEIHAGQVNGQWVVYSVYDGAGASPDSDIYRFDVRTGRTNKLGGAHEGHLRSAPSVSSDGTSYYLRGCSPDCTDLVRQAPGEAPVLLAVLPADIEQDGPWGHIDYQMGQTRVEDRPNGSRVVYATVGNDIYRVVDQGSAG